MQRLPFLALALFGLVAPCRAEPVSGEWVSRWRADLSYAADSLPANHPNFLHQVTRERYRSALDSLSARLPRLAHHEIVVELARILAMVGDGHTRLTLPFDSGSGFFMGHAATAATKIPGLVFRHYPIRLGLFGDSLWVIRADSAHAGLLGGRVVTLGDRTAAQAMTAVEPTIPRDNESQVRGSLPTGLVCPEILQARGVVSDMERLPIEVERGDGSRVKDVLSPVQPGSAVRWIEARAADVTPLSDRSPERAHWFTRIPGTQTFYARYREVRDDPKEAVAAFADSLFAAIAAAHGDRLVIDIRGNMGGNGWLNRPLVQHMIRAERLWRPGGLWVLVDRATFSAAVMLAADLEMRTPAVFVGEKTGGGPNSYGDSRRVLLPNTGLTARISSLYWQLTSPQDGRDGIAPHIPVTMTFGDWRSGRDPALEIALAGASGSASGGAGGSFAGSWNGQAGWQFERMNVKLRLESGSSQGGSKAGGWRGTVDIPDAQLQNAPLAGLRVSEEELQAYSTAGGEKWTIRGRLVGARMVGILGYKGLEFPLVLEREPVGQAGH